MPGVAVEHDASAAPEVDGAILPPADRLTDDVESMVAAAMGAGLGVAGGMVGALIQGFRRAAFSNEAGVGSAAIAHSAVRTKEPVTEGYVSGDTTLAALNDGHNPKNSQDRSNRAYGNWPKKGNSTGFPEAEWISTLANTMKVDDYLAANAAVLDEHDPEGRIGIYLDEWGTWYDPEEGHEPGFLYQQNSLRDVLVAALNFNIFHRHTKRLHMANIAQTVNVLQAVVLTEGDRMVRTPTYHAFMLYKPFMDATFVPVEFDEMTEYELDDVSVPTLSASAALTNRFNRTCSICPRSTSVDQRRLSYLPKILISFLVRPNILL